MALITNGLAKKQKGTKKSWIQKREKKEVTRPPKRIKGQGYVHPTAGGRLSTFLEGTTILQKALMGECQTPQCKDFTAGAVFTGAGYSSGSEAEYS